MLVSGNSAAAFSPSSLFAAGEQGAWFDASDMTTMFEDSAGTIAVHTPGNGVADSPVGKWLDKSGRGNHAIQATSGFRPTLSAKYNLLRYTEQFDNNIFWSTVDATAVANQTTAPDGTSTADFLRENASTNRHVIYNQYTNTTQVAANYTFSVCAKAGTRQYFGVQISGGPVYTVYFDLSNGTVTSVKTTGSPTNTSNSITSLGNGWYRCTVSSDLNGTGQSANFLYAVAVLSNVGNPTNLIYDCANYTGNGTSGLYIWGADFRFTNDGVGLPVYQKVVDANTYDSTGFPYYLVGDAFNRKALATGNINLSSTNKVSTWAAVRKFTDDVTGGTALIFETSDANDLNNGAFGMFAPAYNKIANSAVMNSRGTVVQTASTSTAFATPSSKVITGTADIGANSIILRANGTQVGSSTANQGGGTYLTYPLNLLCRSNGSFQFSGRLYGAIIRGAQSTATQISNTESWLNSVAKIY